nr:CHAT domain-containing protein [candidate division Zixibacteria bacterium]
MIIKRAHGLLIFLISIFIAGSGQGGEQNAGVGFHDEIRGLLIKAREFMDNGEFDSMLTLATQAQELGESNPSTPDSTMAGILNMVGLSYYCRGNYGLSDSIYSLALEYREKTDPPEDSLISDIIGNIAKLKIITSQYSEAAEYLNQSLAIRERIFGEDHLETAKCVSYLAVLYYYMDEFQKAIDYNNRALDIQIKNLGPNHYDVGMTLNNLAIVYDDMGRYTEAESLYHRSLEVQQDVFGPGHYNILSIMYNLTLLKTNLGKYNEADSLNREILEQAKTTIGLEHPLIAMVMDVYALNDRQMGRYSSAIIYHQKALEIRKRVFGEKNADVVMSLSNIGRLNLEMGQYDRALANFERVLAIEEDLEDIRPLNRASTYANLAVIYNVTREYDKALEYGKKSLDIKIEILGNEHPLLASDYQNLSNVYDNLGDYKLAESLNVLANQIYETAYGRKSSSYAKSVNNLGHLYYGTGKYEESEKLLLEALDIYGVDFDRMASLHGLARLYAAMDNYDKSLEYYRLYIETMRKFINYAFTFSSEEQKLRWIDQYSPMEHSLFSMALKSNDEGARRLALDMVLKSKSLVVDAIMSEGETAYCSYNDQITAKLKQRGKICTIIANLVMAAMGEDEENPYGDSLQVLYYIQDSLETEISRMCADFKNDLETGGFTPEDIAAAIPENTVLWEYVRFKPHDFKARGNDFIKTGAPHYLAFILDHNGRVGLVDLGEATIIDSLVTVARRMIYESGSRAYSPLIVQMEKELSEITSQLKELLFRPLAEKNPEVKDIYLAPDGLLNLLPFEILPDSGSSYIIEHYRLCYLSSGRDLLRPEEIFPPNPEVVIIADPDFDNNTSEMIAMKGKATDDSGMVSLLISQPDRGSVECLKDGFRPLRYGREESALVAEAFWKNGANDVREFCGSEAREEIIKGLDRPPRVLHFTTHGFFCSSENDDHEKILVNPLLRSGLALAGANRIIKDRTKPASGIEDGLLTAFEVSRINLMGTELATLSACETGVGETSSGQGVFGLRRAFAHTGVRSILMTLWKIPDRETAELMDGFYRGWLGGKSKQDALRESALAILNRLRAERGTGHPVLWGGFVLNGNPD